MNLYKAPATQEVFQMVSTFRPLCFLTQAVPFTVLHAFRATNTCPQLITAVATRPAFLDYVTHPRHYTHNRIRTGAMFTLPEVTTTARSLYIERTVFRSRC